MDKIKYATIENIILRCTEPPFEGQRINFYGKIFTKGFTPEIILTEHLNFADFDILSYHFLSSIFFSKNGIHYIPIKVFNLWNIFDF